MFKLNLERLTEFVGLLKAADYPNDNVDMCQIRAPSCRTPGCHAGMVFIAISWHKDCGYDFSFYSYQIWAHALAKFLFNDSAANKSDLEEYMENNRSTWGNSYGGSMFSAGCAFGQETNTFPHQVIIDHWAGVLERFDRSK